MTRQRRLERDPLVAERAPLLAEAVPYIAHPADPQPRHDRRQPGPRRSRPPSCRRSRWRSTPGSGCSAPAASAGSTARDFFAGLFTTALEPDEMLVEVALPPPPPRTGWAFLEVARRHGDYAQVGVAARGDARRGRPLPRGAAGLPERRRRPGRARARRPRLLGEAAAAAEAIAAAAERPRADEIDPTGDIHATADFKRHLARVLTGARPAPGGFERGAHEGGCAA